MGIALPRVLCLGFVSFFASAAAFAQQVSPQPLITQPINESQIVALRGNTHPLAQPQFDIGPAPGNLPMQRMLLVLKRDPQQEFALHKLLDDQQDKASPNYHKWLTPDEFGLQFGPSDQDIQLVAGWLQTHGFQINRVTHGRSVIEFSGFESQVEQAFHTQIHQYSVNGQVHWANASDPQIPVALAPAVAGLRSLHNFPAHTMLQALGVVSRDRSTGQITPIQPPAQANSPRPLFTLPVGTGNFCGVQPGYCYGVGPYDFATIYNELPLWNASPAIDGTGETVAIIGETDIDPQDVTDFRNFFGLPAGTLNIIHDGPAPGILSNGEETESDLDVEWSGAVAKGATIDFVVAETTETTWGIDLAALHAIDQNLAPVMSESYGLCELGLGPAGNQFYSSLWAQAAAQGITVMLSAGDGGSAGCDDFNISAPATLGLQVSGFASTPFNVAVGGTDFYDLSNPAPYWSKTNNSTTRASALKYIPETTWDDSCTNPIFSTLGFSTNAETNCNDPQLVGAGFVNILGGSGGKSSCTQSDGVHPASCSTGYPKPSWQVAPGVPADGVRDLPDVSLFAAVGSPSGSFYIICEADRVPGTSCNPSDPATYFFAIGGTSASSPAFAGVMALVNQKMHAPQGIANYVLYKLAAQQTASSCNSTNGSGANCVFNDITTGTIAMPCQAGSPDCTVKTAGHQYGILNGYSTGSGYDLATGLGSVNVANLVNKWSSVSFRATNTTLSLSPTSSLTHGQNVNITASITPGSGTTPPTPSGTISLLTTGGLPAGNYTLDNTGSVSSSTNLLPGGSYSVTAHYGGDSIYGGSDSAPVNITIGKENSSPQIDLQTFDWQGNLISNNASTAVYGSPSLLRVDVLNSAGNPCQVNNVIQSGCPTGNITLTDNASPLTGSPFGLNSLGYAEDQFPVLPGGSNSVKAQYAGDSSFNPGSTTRVLNITPAPTTMYSNLNGATVGANYSASAFVQSQSSGAPPTGTVTFYANGKAVPGTVTYSSFSYSVNPPTIFYQANFTSSNSPFPTPGNYAITGSYSGDANYQPASFNSGTLFVQFAAPVINLQGSPNPVNAGSSTKLVATVLGGSPTIAPTGTIGFGETTTGNLPGNVSYFTITDPNTGNLDLRGTLTITPAFTDGYIASYSGDFNYQPTGFTSPTVVTVSGNDFVLTAPGNTAYVYPGGSGLFQLFVGVQSSTAPVSFTCSGLPSEATCSASPNPTSSLGTVYLTISTTAPNRALATKTASISLRYLWLSSTLPFAAILLIGFGRGATKRSLARLSLTFLLLLGIACGGGSGGGGGGGGGGTPPGAPRNLTATPVSSSQIDLSWTGSASATSYTIYRSATSGFTPSSSNQLTNGWTATSLADSGLSPSTSYYYVVKAVNSSGSSAPSNQASASTQAFDPGTLPGTYNITVTGTSGSGANVITHSTTVTLVVN